MLRTILLVIASFTVTSAVEVEASSPTGWSPVVIPTGAYRERIKALPIQERPGRPLHVYGNTVRSIEHARKSDRPVRPLGQILFGLPSRSLGGL